MTDLIVIQTTIGTRADADAIAAALVARRLAACVQISGPLTSTYRWQDKIETAEEWLITIKTDRRWFAAVERELLALHTYEQPEIIALPVVEASAGYAAWVQKSLTIP